jgi:predicted PurR-regulated permease PerM
MGLTMTTGQTFRNTCIILLTLVGAYAIVMSIRIIIVLLIAIIIASAIRPFVNAMTKRRIPAGVAILFIYVVLAIFIGLIFVAALPPIVNQVTQYFENDSRLAQRIIVAQRWVENLISEVINEDVSLVDPQEIRNAVSDFVQQMRDSMPSVMDNLSSLVGEAVLIFVIGAYWLTSHEKATKFLKQIFPLRYHDNVEQVINEIETTLGGYVRGSALVAMISGMLNFVILNLFSVPNATTIALMVGITTTIPMIGGVIGFFLGVLITLVSDPQYLLIVVVVMFAIQQLESYVFSPRIMSSSVGLDPLLVIVYTSIGFVLFGVVGALIAVPVMGTLHILLLHLIVEPHKESIKSFETVEGLPIIRSDEEPPPASPIKILTSPD